MPPVGGSVAWLDCRVLPETHTQQAYDTFFIAVVAVWADERAFRDGRWHLDQAPEALRPTHHLGGGVFTVSGPTATARMMPARGQ